MGSKIININKDFDEYLLNSFIKEFKSIEEDVFKIIKDNDKSIEKKELPTIEIRISSYGGDVNVANAIITYIEYLKSLGCKIRTKVFGYAYSCGALIFMHGDERIFADKCFSLLIWHDMQLSQGFKDIDRHIQNAEEYKKTWQIHVDYLLKTTNITKELLKENSNNKEWFIRYEEAKELNIVTE